MKQEAAELAAKGILIGTSSWKYEGWLDQLYTPARYEKQRKGAAKKSDDGLFPGLAIEARSKKPVKVGKKRFEAECLCEYAEVFKTVSVDATYYKFPSKESLQSLADQVPDDFRFGFKVTDAITIQRYPNHPDYGARAGQLNKDFLNPELFTTAFLKPCETIRNKIGILMFEFSRFWPGDHKQRGDFTTDLDAFLGQLPKGWPYAIELRNKEWLQPDYFDCLSRHGITHVYNHWDAMPGVSEQMALPDSRTNPQLVAARFLTKPGRKYQDAKRLFQPYKLTKEVNDEARKAIAALIKLALAATGGNLIRALIFINNRLEGNALNTIAAVLESGEWR